MSKFVFLIFLFNAQLINANSNICEVDDTITKTPVTMAKSDQETFNRLLHEHRCSVDILEFNGYYPRRIERIEFVVPFEWRGGISYRQLYQCTHSLKLSPDRERTEDLGYSCVQLSL